MLVYVILIIVAIITLSFLYIRQHINKGEKNKIFLDSPNLKDEVDLLNSIDESINYNVRSNQTVEIDNTKNAIKKIIRRYSNINSITVQQDHSKLEDNIIQPILNEVTISEGSAFDEDTDMDFDSISENLENPSLNDLTLIKEIETDSSGNELYKIVDLSLHDKIRNQFEMIAKGDVDDDDDIMNEFKSFKFANSYAENTDELFNDLHEPEDNKSEENELEIYDKTEIITANKEKTFNFTEKLNHITDNTLEFNFDFEETEENNN